MYGVRSILAPIWLRVKGARCQHLTAAFRCARRLTFGTAPFVTSLAEKRKRRANPLRGPGAVVKPQPLGGIAAFPHPMEAGRNTADGIDLSVFL